MKTSLKPIPLIFLLLLTGCATVTGPVVNRADILQAQQELQVKALKFRLAQEERISRIGLKLLDNLPQSQRQGSFPFLGMNIQPLNSVNKELFNLSRDKGMVVTVVIPNSPVDLDGLKIGDVLLKIDDVSITQYTSRLYQVIKNLEPHQTITFTILRGKEEIYLPVKVGSIPLEVSFAIVDQQEVNAAAAPGLVMVTYGLVRFAESDDELAIILGHELAHLTRKHLSKGSGAQVLTTIIALALGAYADSQSPGIGTDVTRGAGMIGDAFNARYSRDLEREADYFGIYFSHTAGYDIEVGTGVWERFAIEVPASMMVSFQSTHPSSPERFLKIQKTIQEIKESKHLLDLPPAEKPESLQK